MDTESNHMLVEVLQRASSQIPEILKAAEEKLKGWETQPGFYAVLAAVSNSTTDDNVRLMSILYIKSRVNQFWKLGAPYTISENEKHNIRQSLLRNFSEPINQIAVQRAALISTVAQIDHEQWSELFPELLTAIQNPDSLIQHRALVTMDNVIAAIQNRVQRNSGKKPFHEYAFSIYSCVFNLWDNYTGAFVGGFMQNASVQFITFSIEMALLTLAILRKLVVFGFYEAHEDQYRVSFIRIIFEKVETILQCRRQLEGKGIYVFELFAKFVVELTQVLISVLEEHQTLYVNNFLRPTWEFVYHYLFTDEGRSLLFERFNIQCFDTLNTLESSLLCFECDSAIHDVRRQFFQPEIVLNMFRMMVNHYLLLTQDELNLWDADPEEFANDKVADSWKGALRPNVEVLFVTLSRAFEDCFIMYLGELMESINVLVPPQNLQDILKKDAAYNAVSLNIFIIKDKIEGGFVDTLLRDLNVKDNSYKVIRSRVLFLIQRLIQHKFPGILRPAVCDCIIESLSSNEDMAVRLAAMSTLELAIIHNYRTDRNFNKFLVDAHNLLFTLLKESKEWHTKRQVLSVMDALYMYMDREEPVQVASLTQYLLYLWEESKEHIALRCSVLQSLVLIVEEALQDVGHDLILLLVPVVQFGYDISQDDAAGLLKDSLELWMAILEYSPTITDDLIRLFDKMPSLLENSKGTLHQSLSICVAHLLLAPELFIRTSGPRIMEVCAGLMPQNLLKQELRVLALLVETLVRTSPISGAETVLPILPKLFEKIYVTENRSSLLTIIFCTLSRTLLASHEAMTRVLNGFARANNGTELVMLGNILDVWLDKMKTITQPNHLKLLSLALINMLTTECVPVLERFGLIMSNIVRALNAIIIMRYGTMTDPLVLKVGQDLSEFQENIFDTMTFSVPKVKEEDGTTTNEEEKESPHDRRKKQMILSDPVHRIILTDYLQSQWCELRNKAGDQQFQQLLQCLDGVAVCGLKKFKIIQ